jgi:Txe/YoeB family toxin of toxin-antitoxin system
MQGNWPTPALEKKAEILLQLLSEYLIKTPPPYEKLIGDPAGACSRRINMQHRLVYQVLKNQHTVKGVRIAPSCV